MKTPIPLPVNKEQEKIGLIFSHIDNAIKNTHEIIEQTYLLKKSMMQNLLTKGIGHTKFKKIKWDFRKEIQIPDKWDFILLDKSMADCKTPWFFEKESNDVFIVKNCITEKNIQIPKKVIKSGLRRMINIDTINTNHQASIQLATTTDNFISLSSAIAKPQTIQLNNIQEVAAITNVTNTEQNSTSLDLSPQSLNSPATTMMIAERAAEFIREGR